jgi:hypothetical protein
MSDDFGSDICMSNMTFGSVWLGNKSEWHKLISAQCINSEQQIIPNFKNFLSLHSFVQSLAEQKHALEISEHTLIIMCNNKAGYNSYSKMPKRTYTAQQSGKFGGPGQTLTWGLSRFHVLTLWLGGPGASPGKILKSEVLEMAKSCILEVQLTVISMYISLQFFICPPPFNSGPRANCTPLGGLDSTCNYDYLWQLSFIITWLKKINIFVLANERRLTGLGATNL